MSSLGSVVVVALAIALVVTTGLMLRYRRRRPWPAIVVAMLTSAACFAVGSGSNRDAGGPRVATVVAGVVGLLSVAAAVMALVPHSRRTPPTRAPIMLASLAMVVGAAGLVVNQLTS
jgi:drug/metabolite transporter (DMT)-like permease